MHKKTPVREFFMLIFIDEFPKTFPFVSKVFRKIVHYQAK
jgi:hypothetical protein